MINGKKILFLQIFVSQLLFAISMRDDVAQPSYVAISMQPAFESTGSFISFPLQAGNENCTTTLINPRTALLAAHCLVGISDDCISPYCLVDFPQDTEFGFGLGPTSSAPVDVAIVSMYIPHQMYNGSSIGSNDIALIALNRRIPYTKFPQIAEESYAGFQYTLVGYGSQELGSGNPSPIVPGFGQRVGCMNVIDKEVTDQQTLALLGYAQSMLVADFDCPLECPSCQCSTVCGGSCNADEAVLGIPSSPIPLPFEGISTDGDSGGPVYVQVNGLTYIAGVVSAGLNNSNTYGQIDIYTPSHIFLNWITANNPLRRVHWTGGSGLWNTPLSWSEQEVPNNYQGSLNQNTATYYEAAITSGVSLTADIDFTVDVITLTHPQASFEIPLLYSPIAYEFHLQEGTLIANGLFSSSFSLEGGSVYGQGILHAILPNVSQPPFISTLFPLPPILNAGATVTPGSSSEIGILTMQGDYIQTFPGSLKIKIKEQTCDLLQIQAGDAGSTGHTSLDGTLILENLGISEPLVAQLYSFLQANSIEGQFDTIHTIGIPPSLKPQLTYLPQEVLFEFVPTTDRAPIYTAYLAHTLFTQNNQYILQLIQGMHNKTPLNSSQAPTSYEPCEKQLLATNSNTFQIGTEALHTLRTRSRPAEIYWGPTGSFGSADSTSHAPGFSYSSVGALAGLDYAFSHGGIGAFFDYTHFWLHGDQQTGKAQENTWQCNLYGTWIPYSLDRLSWNVIAGMGYSTDIFDRKVPLTTGFLQATGKTHSLQWNGCTGLEYTYAWSASTWPIAVVPLVYFQYLYANINSFTERGASLFNLEFHGQQVQTFSSIVGTRFNVHHDTRDRQIYLELDTLWIHQFLDLNTHLSFAPAFGGSFSDLQILVSSRNAFLGGLNGGIRWNHKIDTQLSYNVNISGQNWNQFVYLKMGILF